MFRKKQSGAQGRRRKREAEKNALVNSTLMTSFLKKPKLNAAECVHALETRSEDDDCQPTILEDETEIGELYHHQSSPDNSGQTCVTPYIEKDANGVFELAQKTSSFLGYVGVARLESLPNRAVNHQKIISFMLSRRLMMLAT